MLLLLALLLVIGLGLVQRRFHVLQYLFFLRYPLGAALLVPLLPLLSLRGPLAGAFESLYAVDHWFAGFWIGLATTWWFAVSWLSGELIFRGADQRFALTFSREGEGDWANDRWLEARLGARARELGCVAVFALAISPTLVALALRSPRPAAMVLAAVLGHASIVVALRWESRARPLHRLDEAVGAPLRARVRAELPVLSRRLQDPRWRALLAGYDDLRGHQVAGMLLGATASFYGFGAVALRPWEDGILVELFPALGYLLTLLTLLALLLPGLSFLLDGFRVPTLVAIAAVVLPLQLVVDHDHVFATSPVDPAAAVEPVDPAAAVAARFSARAGEPEANQAGREPVLVVVAASGGGGQAAVWTSRVFEGLGDDGEWGPRVLGSVAMVSSVSGGSVGAMYWVDGYGPKGPPEGEVRRRIVAAAAAPSLEAMSWGVIYPDIISTLLPGLGRVLFAELDRGQVLERSWARRLGGDEAPSLRDWSVGVAEGWRPLQIFNAVAIESGCRVLLASAALPPASFPGAIVFPGDRVDVDVATAARLSASFPYLSPAARAVAPVHGGSADADAESDRGRDCARSALGSQHVLDGGYYDNFGVVTAMQWIDAVLRADQADAHRFRRVIVIEIRAMARGLERSNQASNSLMAQLAGPLFTLMTVGVASQRDRNDEQLRRFAADWASRGVRIDAVTFEDRQPGRLTWTLASAAITEIRDSWTEDAEVVCQRRRLCGLVDGDDCPPPPPEGC